MCGLVLRIDRQRGLRVTAGVGQTAALYEQHRQIEMCRGEIRFQPQSLFVLRQRFVITPFPGERGSRPLWA